MAIAVSPGDADGGLVTSAFIRELLSLDAGLEGFRPLAGHQRPQVDGPNHALLQQAICRAITE